MKIKRILSFLLILSMLLCIIPTGVFAADPSVVMMDGERTVFVSSFGRVSYKGSAQQAFKTFADALNALGKEGGKIILSGVTNVSEFADIPGRGPVVVEGTGTSAYANRLEFGALENISFEGPIKLNDVTIKTQAGAQIFTNGHSYSTNANFDTYYQVAYKDTPKTYIDPPAIAFGEASNHASLGLASGKYAQVTAGSVNGYTTNGNFVASVDGASADYVIAGNYGKGTHNGNVSVTVTNGEIDKFLAGTDSGTLNGNSITKINGGSINTLSVGAQNGGKINGNIVVQINGGTIGSIASVGGVVSGKKVAMLDSDYEIKLPSGVFDYVIKIDGGFGEVVFDANKIAGFRILNEMGIPANTISVNGKTMSSDSGVYTLSAGESNVVVPDAGKLSLNKNANYIKGYEDGSFRPQNNMTKAEAVTLLARLLVDENLIKGTVQSGYLDVAEGSWYESYIGFFERLGFLDLVTEDNGLNFAPDKNITRAQFTQLIYEISDKDDSSASKKTKAFVDVTSGNPYKNAITFAASAGIITGYEDATFRPDNNISRAEVVTMVNRLLGRIPTGTAGSNNFNDIAGHWANPQILASCNPENVSWTSKGADSDKYVLEGTSAKDYVTALYNQGITLSSEAIRDGIDVVSEQMKKDVLNQPDTLDLSGKRVFYISEKHGSDANDGLTPETAFQTIAGLSKVSFLRNVAVLFERGGIYRGSITFTPYTYYGAYGDTSLPKPLLMQSRRNFADPSLWVETEYPNVYKCTELFHNVGVVGFDHDLFDYSEKCYDELYGEIEGLDFEGFTGPENLNKDLQFYNKLPDNVTNAELRDQNPKRLGELYVYSDKGNPGSRFKSIEVGERYAIFKGDPTGIVIENLALKFTGAHGIETSTMKGLTVRGCVFSWIGGSMLDMNYGVGLPYRYGNAVEGQICQDFICENNWAYQIYDTGLTHQRGQCNGTIIQDRVRYTNNLVEYCHWGIEFYNNPAGKKANDITLTQNVYIAYNVVRLTGYGWGSIVSERTRHSQAYHGSSCGDTKNLVTEYNVFDRSAGYLLNVVPGFNIDENRNIYIQHLGNILGNLNGNYHMECDEKTAEYIVNEWKDENGIVILIDPEKDPADVLFK